MAMNAWGGPEPAWWLNLQTHPEASVDLPRESRAVRARVADGEERSRLWARMAAVSRISMPTPPSDPARPRSSSWSRRSNPRNRQVALRSAATALTPFAPSYHAGSESVLIVGQALAHACTEARATIIAGHGSP